MLAQINLPGAAEYPFNPAWFLHLPVAPLPLDGDELIWGWQQGKLVKFSLEQVVQVDAVTSVGLSMPSIFSVSGSPVTTTGTLTATLVNQAQNSVFAGPSSGGAGLPTFRPLVSTDLPTIQPAQGGTGQTSLTAHAVLVGEGTSAVAMIGPGATNTILAGNTGADPSFQTFAGLMLTWFNSLPKTLPGSSGILWNNGGTLAQS